MKNWMKEGDIKMISGLNKELLIKLNSTFTMKEIEQQPVLWKETIKIIEDKQEAIKKFIKENVKENTRIVLTGAGTSDYVGDSIYLHLAKSLGVRVEAIATTDIVSNPKDFIEEDTQTILVSFARSGNSPESVGAYKLFNDNVKDITQLIITCSSSGELAKAASLNENSMVIVMPEKSNDKGFAMTSSFTCMMLATILFFDINNIDSNKKNVDIIANQGEKILTQDWEIIKEICDYNPERLVYLGSGCLSNLCQEMALKNLELTSGKIMSIHESILGFRHGPKSLVDDNTVVIALTSSEKYTNLYDLDLIQELYKDDGNHKVVAIAYKHDERLKSISDKYIAIDGQDVPEVYTCFNYILFGQMIGLLNSIKLGISPDNPRPDGTVNRVVQGVVIHEYEK